MRLMIGTLLLSVLGFAQVDSVQQDSKIKISNEELAVLNTNFRTFVAQRIAFFPRPNYVKNLKSLIDSGGLTIELVRDEELDKFNDFSQQFIKNRKILIGLDYQAAATIASLLNRNSANQKNLEHGFDLVLMAADLILEKTSTRERSDIVSKMESISNVNSISMRQKMIEIMIAENLTRIASMTPTLVLRFMTTYPTSSFSAALDAILGGYSTSAKRYVLELL